MIRHLVLDIVWRSRLMYLLMLPIVGLLWSVVGSQGDEFVAKGLGLSITFAYALTLVAVSLVGLREIRIRPVTNRDLWVTTWLVAAVVVPLAISAVQTLAAITSGSISGSSVSGETLFLSSLYCFAYAGALVPITPALGYSLNNITTRTPRWPWIALSIGCLLIFTGALVLPYLIADDLPLTFAQLSWGTTMALILCFVISAAGLAWTPQRGGVITPVQPAKKTESASQSQERQRTSDRFTGISRIAWPLLAMVAIMSAVTVVGFVGYWAAFESNIPLQSFLQNNAVLLFETGFLPNPEVGHMWVTLTLVFITTSNPWRPFVRLIKVLPLTTAQINALFLATPFALWAVVWLALIATHVAIVARFPGNVRPDVFVFVGGLSALGQGFMTRYGQKGNVWMIVLIGGLMPIALRLSAGPWSMSVEAIMVAVGLAALLAAAIFNHRTLTRSTSSSTAYRAESLPFGINVPAGRP